MFGTILTIRPGFPPYNDLPSKCSKCDNAFFAGPVYIDRHINGLLYYECLRYTCTCCGCVYDVRTKDAQ